MPRHNRVYRRGNKVVVVLGNIEHELSEPAFIEFIEQALNVTQALARQTEHKQPAGLDLTLTFACPTCQAAPGIECSVPGSGVHKLAPHVARVRLAERGATREPEPHHAE